MITVVVCGAGTGARALVRTADSVARQDVPVEMAIAQPSASVAHAVIASIQQRLGATHADGPTPSRAIEAAVGRSSGDVLLLPAPWRLSAGAVARCAAALDANPGVAVVVPGLRVESADGRLVRTLSVEPTVAQLLAAPLSTPPVFAIRRQLWNEVGGLDEEAGPFAACDWWLRVIAACAPSASIVSVPEPLAILVAVDGHWWPPVEDESIDLARFRMVLERHRGFLERHMADLVVEREMALGRLMARHRAALRDRDAHLAELDRLRAEAAHHRAYLDHHGRAAFDWGDLRRPDPVSRDWGYDRGDPLDRRYIDDFLATHSSDVRGRVLEVQEDDFTRQFGGPRVTRSAVVDLDDRNPRATVVADLRAASGIDGNQFDCIILTQTLHVIADMPAVLRECWRLLAPGGVLLATLPSASRVCLEYGSEGDLWRMTPAGAAALFEPVFGASNVSVTPYGSVLTNVAFLHGLASAELTEPELDATDPYHPVLAGVRARKAPPRPAAGGARPRRGVVLLYHRVADDDDVHDLALPAGVLADQLAWLRRECRVIPLDELLTAAPEDLPDRAAAITFDDGYLDTLEAAAPLLERDGVPATVFATTRWLERPGEYWWDVLEGAFLRSEPPPSLTLDLDGRPVTFPTRAAGERRVAHDRLHARMVHAALDERDRIVGHIAQWSACRPDNRRRPLVSEELRRLARIPGISIGAHGVDHLALPDQGAAEQRREIADSVSALERVLSRPVRLFAFPYGAVDRASAGVARSVCHWSVSCRPGAVGASFDAAGVPRIEVNRRWSAEFRERIERAFAGRLA